MALKDEENEDLAATYDLLKNVRQCYEKVVEIESKQGDSGGNDRVGVNISKRFVKQIRDLEQNKASVANIFEWVKDVVRTLRNGLNGGKPF